MHFAVLNALIHVCFLVYHVYSHHHWPTINHYTKGMSLQRNILPLIHTMCNVN